MHINTADYVFFLKVFRAPDIYDGYITQVMQIRSTINITGLNKIQIKIYAKYLSRK